jgi:hypothetical protein
MVGGQVEALMRKCKIRRNTFGNTEVYEIRDFMYVRSPESRMARGEVD